MAVRTQRNGRASAVGAWLSVVWAPPCRRVVPHRASLRLRSRSGGGTGWAREGWDCRVCGAVGVGLPCVRVATSRGVMVDRSGRGTYVDAAGVGLRYNPVQRT